MSQTKLLSIATFGVTNPAPSETTRQREAWNDRVHKLDETIKDLKDDDAEPERIAEKEVEMEKAALEFDAWDFKRALDDPNEISPLLERRFEEAVRKVKEFKSGSSAFASEKTPSSRS